MTPCETSSSKRPRGRPPKVKRGSLKPRVLSASENSEDGLVIGDATESSLAMSSETGRSDSGTPVVPNESSTNSISESPTSVEKEVATGSKRTSHHDEDAFSRKRVRTESSEIKEDQNLEITETRVSTKPTMLPARRSTRQTTVYATQVSEGTLRPPGPPCLEAALNIALRNLESETWLYLWSYHKKHQGEPLPTPAEIKQTCPPVRRAAEAVDKADRELEDAIDEIMRANSKKKRRGGTSASRHVDKRSDADLTQTPSRDIEQSHSASAQSKDEASGAIVTGGISPIVVAMRTTRSVSASSPGTSAASTPLRDTL